jgi:alpha-galactosidase
MVSPEHVSIVSAAARGMRIVTIRIAVALSVLAIAFAGSSLGAEPINLPKPPKDLATPTLDTATMGMSQSAWSTGVNQWLETNLFKPGFAPFSFVYDGKCSREFLAGWDFTTTKKQLNNTQTQHILTYTDPKTGLEVRCEAVVFNDYPAVEWVLKFKNTEGRETPIISDIQALDTTLTDQNNEFTLHHALGVGEGIDARKEDLRPLSRPLPPDSNLKISPLYGRSSWGDSLPFFNIEMSNNQGVIASIGWTGQWLANFSRDANSLTIRAGMELTHLKLYPGEEIRSPRIMLLFWQGHRYYGQNLLRRMILAHYHPQKDGKPVTMPFTTSLHFDNGMEQSVIDLASQAEKLGVEYLWLDAGWWDRTTVASHIGPIDPKRFPNGFRPLADALKQKGMGLLVWFAPEYPGGGSWLDKAFPEMFLRLKDKPDGITMLNLGNKNAWEFIVNHMSAMIAKQGIGIFRIDGPLGADCP